MLLYKQKNGTKLIENNWSPFIEMNEFYKYQMLRDIILKGCNIQTLGKTRTIYLNSK